ncbi:1-acyl-sn-glycerol-3-phosphate acyltransferase [Streptomyces tanashiensis]|uniref:lysophospholipid acyltransferase family protein n=1 Tax=Streptomyces tanashiensis TaxID=67367 RepID=UPI00167AA123|nr:lysophospholipid acyltransferase family protein [Streptomyces tanashiensis]GGT00457.1 1-acyl-sn-glycerol-3-phosphate acyltransferase [Streptomyces tanashiensis]
MNGSTALPPWLPTAPCTPGRCAAHPETGRDHPAERAGAVLAAARLTAGIGAVLVGVLLAPAAGLLPAAARLALVRSWVRAVVRAFGVRVRYEGTADAVTGPLLVVANHVSWLDIPLVAAVLPGRMVAKTEVRRWPVLGTLAALGGTLFIDRDRLRALPATVRAMSGVLADGGRVVVFPEGSTWCGRARGRFRPAAFQAALDSGSAVLPVRLDYGPTGAAAYVGDDPLGASLWRVVTARRMVASIRILDPISSIQYPDRRALAAAAERAVARPTVPEQTATEQTVPEQTAPEPGVPRPTVPQPTVAKDSANLSSLSVHQRVSSRPTAASSFRTPA